ncbi:holin family protein [Leisingera daeponensis]|uniref:Holin family protein n=1 Tax=Leisingera daeponensis TaxID=405746 RepID=A0ABS7NB22_9RHOB|nr:holin family protein [Leisingera daeponensis]MBY6138402.1 holin family protein [Leisingera daeponensis]
MGLITEFLSLVFGGQRNALRETVEVFRENAEAGAQRAHDMQAEALRQMAAEFRHGGKSRFDRFMDGVNRLPRPMLALGTVALLISALSDPVWFAARMQGLALVPEPLWWLLGVIVSFYFGARHQMKSQEFQQGLAASMAQVPHVARNIAALERLRADTPAAAGTGTYAAARLDATETEANPALEAWKTRRG